MSILSSFDQVKRDLVAALAAIVLYEIVFVKIIGRTTVRVRLPE